MAADREPTYWRSLPERAAGAGRTARADDLPQLEAPAAPPGSAVTRRGFLQAAGFTAVGSVLASCARAPVEKAIPLLVAREELVPGRALYYASTCAACPAACGLVMKCRDGRPVKLEGNPAHPLSRGALCAAGQAALLGLYDSRRLTAPLASGRPASWPEIDRAIVAALDRFAAGRGAVRVLTPTVTSPTVRRGIERLLARFANGRHVVVDVPSAAAILDAHAATHGVRALPRFRFERAEVIASFGADFLGTWISPVEFAAGWRAGRELAGGAARMSYVVVLEGRMSLTGSKADRRVRLAPGEVGPALSALAARLAARAGIAFTAPPAPAGLAAAVDDLADRLWAARGRSLVVCDSQDVAVQALANLANVALGNYGETLDLARPSYQRTGSDRDLETLRDELAAGRVDALIVAGSNPLYELPEAGPLAAALARVPLVVTTATHLDETARLAAFVCPDHHPLESWGDAMPVAGLATLRQPAIDPLGGTRALVESLAAWSGAPSSARDLVRETWRRDVLPRAGQAPGFEQFWTGAVERGMVELDAAAGPAGTFDLAAVRPVAAGPAADGLTLVLHSQVGMHGGQHAGNPWLHELPDPVTKVTWDNVASLSPATARRLGVEQGDVVRLSSGTVSAELPAYVQPGQADGVVAVALGYGGVVTERLAGIGPHWIEAGPTVGEDGRVGKNVAAFLRFEGGTLRGEGAPVEVAPTGRRRPLACTQTHETITVPQRLAPAGAARRPVVEETSLEAFRADPHAGRLGEETVVPPLWPADHPTPVHRWAMAVDLSACTGCSACLLACQAENNVPVVGRDEVRRRREMHWIRIDRYYSGDEGDVDVAHQPMLCQQCGNAPCETVCPVLATVHSEEGLNQQVYNRCVGTRYCANNCPYKVRRFNWFAYPHDDRLANLALNPDVTVRSRGVMEKCTFCVQRIQEAKIEARRSGVPLADGAVVPACAQTCPTRAIVFGDLDDPGSRVARAWADPRRYRVLEETGVEPSVGYLRLVRNRPERGGGRNG